jgi:hypothetical protein
MNRTLLLSSLVVLAGCEGAFNPKDGVVKVVDTDETGTPSVQSERTGPPAQAPTCDPGRQYVGLGGFDLAGDRVTGEVGEETRRPKPFTALSTEFPRVLGNTPAMLASSESTFGTIPARWHTEPTLSAVSVYTAFRVAFQGCLTLTAQPAKYNTAPTDTTARTECAA